MEKYNRHEVIKFYNAFLKQLAKTKECIEAERREISFSYSLETAKEFAVVHLAELQEFADKY